MGRHDIDTLAAMIDVLSAAGWPEPETASAADDLTERASSSREPSPLSRLLHLVRCRAEPLAPWRDPLAARPAR